MSAFHLMFWFELTSHVEGRSLMAENIFLCIEPPHMGQSWEARGMAVRRSAGSPKYFSLHKYRIEDYSIQFR